MILELLAAFTLIATHEMPRGREHSGAAFGPQGINLYTIPDSGNSSAAYSWNNGKVEFEITNYDFEDLDIDACMSVKDSWCFYVADTGQNYKKHPSVIHEISFQQPWVSQAHLLDTSTDIEAMAVLNGEFLAIKKNGKGILRKGRSLKRCVDLGIDGYVTGMDALGDKIIVTYHNKDRRYFIEEFLVKDCQVWDRTRLDWSTNRQLEAVTYWDESVVFAVTESGHIYEFGR